MTAHVYNKRLDEQYPATLSRATVDGLLRGELGFKGAVVSDDLRMGAIERQYGIGEAAVLALDAGVDVLLIVDDRLPDGGSATRQALAAIRRALAGGVLDPARVEAAVEARPRLSVAPTLARQQPVDLVASGQGRLRAAPGAGDRGRRAGESQGVREGVAAGQRRAEGAVEGVAGGGRVDGRHRECGNADVVPRRAREQALGTERDDHGPHAAATQSPPGSR